MLSQTLFLRYVKVSLVGAAQAWTFCSWAQTTQYLPQQQPIQQPTASAYAAPTAPPNVGWAQLIARTTGRAVADLYVDGRPVCRLPCQLAIPSGVHVVGGRGPAASSREQRLYFAPGTTVPILLDVIPAGSVVRVTAAVPGTLVYLDGALVGNTNWQGAVAPGTHQLLLRRPSGEQLQQQLNVSAGMTYNIRDNAVARPPGPLPSPAPSGATARNTPAPRAPANPQNTRAPNTAPSPAAPAPGSNQGQEVSPPDTAPTSEEDRYHGMTGALFVPIILGGASTNDYRDHCPATQFGGNCTVSGPRGAAIAGRLGYAFGWIAPEFTLGLSLDLSSGGLHVPEDATLQGDTTGILTQIAGQTKFIRIGILGAAGLRLTSEGRSARFTLSGSFGWVKRHVYVVPDSFFGTKPSYTAKSLFFDTGILLGDTPGAKLYVGFFAWLEFVPTMVIERDVTKLNLKPELVPASLRRVTPFNGTQFMFGPLLGVTFGH